MSLDSDVPKFERDVAGERLTCVRVDLATWIDTVHVNITSSDFRLAEGLSTPSHDSPKKSIFKPHHYANLFFLQSFVVQDFYLPNLCGESFLGRGKGEHGASVY